MSSRQPEPALASSAPMTPLITIVTISFHPGAEALLRTIESVNAQTYHKIEHILIDGGSTDGSVALFHARARRAPRCLSEPDDGISDAFNKGTRAARGDFICYLNAGDAFAAGDVVARAAAAITSDSPATTVYFGDFISLSGGDTRTHPTSAALEDFAWANPINHQSAFIPRPLALQFPYDLRLVLGMDYDFWLRIHATARFHKLPFPVAVFELGGRSSTPAWEVHGLVMHRILWHLHHRSRIGVGDLAGILIRTLRFKLFYVTRRLLGRGLSQTLRRTKSRWLQRTQPATPSFA